MPKVGDFVRDKAQLGGTVLRIGDGVRDGMLFVRWNNGVMAWIKSAHVEQ